MHMQFFAQLESCGNLYLLVRQEEEEKKNKLCHLLSL